MFEKYGYLVEVRWYLEEQEVAQIKVVVEVDKLYGMMIFAFLDLQIDHPL